jgi:hypothetical protein
MIPGDTTFLLSSSNRIGLATYDAFLPRKIRLIQ